MLIYRNAIGDQDLNKILDLQQINLAAQLSQSDIEKEGFVTLRHDLDLLRNMNKPHAHVIAIDEDKLAGYTLVMEKRWKEYIPLLVPMFDIIDECLYGETKLGDSKYFVMGQVCVDKVYRGRGVFRSLYNELADKMKDDFEYCITEISTSNIRSVNAHLGIGFENIYVYKTEDGREWMIVLLKL